MTGDELAGLSETLVCGLRRVEWSVRTKLHNKTKRLSIISTSRSSDSDDEINFELGGRLRCLLYLEEILVLVITFY